MVVLFFPSDGVLIVNLPMSPRGKIEIHQESVNSAHEGGLRLMNAQTFITALRDHISLSQEREKKRWKKKALVAVTKIDSR